MPKSSLAVTVGTIAIGGVLFFGGLPATPDETRTTGMELRTPWGEPDLMGVWKGPKRGASPGQDSFNLVQLERLYRPEARTEMTQISAKDDPTLNCVPPAFPHAAVLGWPIQIVQRPGMAIILTEAFTSFRHIPTDGRGHLSSEVLIPFFGGDSAGKWEGDTLVVDVISFRDAWLAAAQDKTTAASAGVWPTSDALHVLERWRRVDADTLEYQARVEDPMMLTQAWDTPKVTFKRQPTDKVHEIKCLLDDPETPPLAYLAQFGR